MGIYSQSAEILDRAGCIGSQLAPGVEIQAAHFVPKGFNDAVILTAQDKQVVAISPDNGGNFEEMLSR